jgi:hypothetical protein
MLHLKAKKLLPAYLDGELDEKLRQDLEKHLAACAKCRAELESFKQFSARVHEISPVESKPEPFWQAQKDKILQGMQEPESAVTGKEKKKSSSPAPVSRWEWVTAVCSLVILAAAFAYYQFNGKYSFDSAIKKSLQPLSKSPIQSSTSAQPALGFSTTGTLNNESRQIELPPPGAPADYDKSEAGRENGELPPPPPAKGMRMERPSDSLSLEQTAPEEERRAGKPAYGEGFLLDEQKKTEIAPQPLYSKKDLGSSAEARKEAEAKPEAAVTYNKVQSAPLAVQPSVIALRLMKVTLDEAFETVSTTAMVRIISISAPEDRTITLEARNRTVGWVLSQIGITAGLPYQTRVGNIIYLTPEPLSKYTQQPGYAKEDQKVGFYPQDWELEYPLLKGKTGTKLCPHCHKVPIEPTWNYCPVDGTRLH